MRAQRSGYGIRRINVEGSAQRSPRADVVVTSGASEARPRPGLRLIATRYAREAHEKLLGVRKLAFSQGKARRDELQPVGGPEGSAGAQQGRFGVALAAEPQKGLTQPDPRLGTVRRDLDEPRELLASLAVARLLEQAPTQVFARGNERRINRERRSVVPDGGRPVVPTLGEQTERVVRSRQVRVETNSLAERSLGAREITAHSRQNADVHPGFGEPVIVLERQREARLGDVEITGGERDRPLIAKGDGSRGERTSARTGRV